MKKASPDGGKLSAHKVREAAVIEACAVLIVVPALEYDCTILLDAGETSWTYSYFALTVSCPMFGADFQTTIAGGNELVDPSLSNRWRC